MSTHETRRSYQAAGLAALAVLALAWTAVGPVSAAVVPEEEQSPQTVEEIVAALDREGDEADPALLRRLGEHGDRESLDALFGLYESLQTTYMRREVVRSLAKFDGVDGLEQEALEKIMGVATGARERELREAAVESLARCRRLGKAFLATIVDSPADDDVRVRAMQFHASSPRAEDSGWYRERYGFDEDGEDLDKGGKDKKKRRQRESEEEKKKSPHVIQDIRHLAFGALAGKMKVEGLQRASEDRYWKIRMRALSELRARDWEGLLELADKVYGSQDRPEYRGLAARILAEKGDDKIALGLLEDGTKVTTPMSLRYEIADILSELDDESLNKKLLKQVGKGKRLDKLFVMRALEKVEDEKLDKSLRKLLRDKEPAVAVAAAELLARRNVRDAIPELEKLVAKSKNPELVGAALRSLSALRKGDPEWAAALVEQTSSEQEPVRNAALGELGRTHDADHLPLLTGFLDHPAWSTRLAALKGIEGLRSKEGVGALIARMGEESGRMEVEFAEALWRLTGQPFRTQTKLWAHWWEQEGEGFRIISNDELRKREQESERRRLMQRSTTEFFGIRIESHRVAFVIDVSGSMEETTRGRYVGEKGEVRMEVAKAELLRALDSLEHDTLFNVITFSSDVSPWLDRITEVNDETLEEAREFVERLKAFGGTNLYGAMQAAYADPQVDTIFVLSDGEPTQGDVIDPVLIREDIGFWNKDRDVVIHCVAVGGQLQVLEWLAADTGGSYFRYP